MNEHELLDARRFQLHHGELLRSERTCLGDLLLSIAEFENRGLHRVLGYASIFDYLHRALSMSKGMAHYRMVGARLVSRFPEVEQPIRDGRLCLTTVVEVARVMTEENRADVLPRFFGLSRQEARHMASEIDPATVIPRKTVVTAVVPGMQQPAVPPRTAPSGSVGSTVELILTHPGRGIEWVRTKVDPLSVTESRLHITVSREFLALLKQAKAGESHRSPGATDEQVLKVALEALIEKQRRRKAGVPAKVKREVVRRDGGRCQWPLAGGGVCGSTARLEVDHVVPRGRGGADTVENTRLLCRTHNLEAARRAYGDELIDRYAGAPRAPGGP